jgi:ABC-type antimicrobial peptide transport system permease subunit
VGFWHRFKRNRLAVLGLVSVALMLLTAVFAPLIASAVASLRNLGYLVGEDDPDDETLYKALTVFIGTENFEEREQARGYLHRAVLEFMRGKW